MTVYRVENSLGRGMYRGNSRDYLLDAMYDPVLHPTPSNDSRLMRALHEAGLVVQGKYGWNHVRWAPFNFGFSSPDQLRRWLFNDAVKKDLQAIGFSVSVYEGGTEYHGDTQAVFIRNESTLVATIDLMEV